jgi:hypothetical protein
MGVTGPLKLTLLCSHQVVAIRNQGIQLHTQSSLLSRKSLKLDCVRLYCVDEQAKRGLDVCDDGTNCFYWVHVI